MARLNDFLVASTQANKYVTMLYAELDHASRRLTYVNAGHVPPYLVRCDGAVERLTAGGTALGLLEEQTYEVGEVQLEPGDVVVMVTDGVTEALSTDDEEFGDERAVSTLRRLAKEPAQKMVRGLQEAVASWTGPAGCSDDLTVLILKAS
jgi:sigma-B regulation protein RsbU (phosphoserine phosphatase)